MSKYYQIDECYFGEACSAAALKRAHCWGRSIEQVKKAYRAHLDSSGHHSSLTEKQKAAAMEEVKVLEKNWPEEPQKKSDARTRAYEAWEEEPPQKSDASKGDGSRGAAAAASDTKAAAEAEAQRKRQKTEPADEVVIAMKKEDLKQCVEVLENSIKATKKACEFFSNGAAAFVGQEAILRDTKEVFERMLAKK